MSRGKHVHTQVAIDIFHEVRADGTQERHVKRIRAVLNGTRAKARIDLLHELVADLRNPKVIPGSWPKWMARAVIKEFLYKRLEKEEA